jgi:hypothetical protein
MFLLKETINCFFLNDIREVFAMAARIYTGCLQYIVLFVCELPFFSVIIGGQVLPHCSFIYLWFSKNESENTATVHHFFPNLVQLHKSGTFQSVSKDWFCSFR